MRTPKIALKFVRAVALLLVLLSLTNFCSGRTEQLRGRIFAYDPTFHISKMVSFVENIEIVILQLESAKNEPRFIKLRIHGFGKIQIPDDYFAGNSIFTVTAIRDHGCDQESVNFVTNLSDDELPHKNSDRTHDVRLNQGKFIISEHFKNLPLPHLSNLKCYSSKVRNKH